MQATEIIARKRDGKELTTEEIDWLVQGVADESIPDYQIAAWLMAVYLRGMSERETVDLALAMAHSGEMLDLSGVVPFAVDKHSSGGVGDKTTLVVLPLVVACGVPVGKMSGRGLGFSGGTLDKMESIAGYRVDLSKAQFIRQLSEHGIVLCGQTGDLAPADGKLYALRDVTATVSSQPLIAASIMSKKLAAGAHGVVLDVKTGLGAFMPRVEDARRLADLMLRIGRDAGRRVIAVISDMNQPLGRAVGNALEVREALEVLHGEGDSDLRDHCLALAGHMLQMADVGMGTMRLRDVTALARDALNNGSALAMFREMVELQGGDVSMVDDPSRLPTARLTRTIEAKQGGYVAQVSARTVGAATMLLGAGRQRKGEPIDHAVGIIVHVKVGDQTEVGAPLFTLHANDEARLAQAQARLQEAVTWQTSPTAALPLFYDVLG